MDAIASFVAEQGWLGIWLLTISYFGWMLSNGKMLSIREHRARIEDVLREGEGRVTDLKEQIQREKEQTERERRNTEFWQEAAIASSEMGAIISKAKVSLSEGTGDVNN